MAPDHFYHSESRRLPLPTGNQRLDALATMAAVQDAPSRPQAFFQPSGSHQHDPLSQGIKAVSQGLPGIVFPLLETPFSIDATNTVDPSRKAFEMGPTLPPIRAWQHTETAIGSHGFQQPAQPQSRPPSMTLPQARTEPAKDPSEEKFQNLVSICGQ